MPTNEQWEYQIHFRERFDGHEMEWLTTMGNEGWQLASVVPRPGAATKYVLMRRKQSDGT